MPFLRINKLVASGPEVETSEITFGKKLTVIAGPSDSGKSCIYKCIDYIFGGNNSDDNLPFDEQEGYTTIRLEMETHKGTIILERVQKSTITSVISNIPDIESGDYSLKSSDDNKSINDLFLGLIDAPKDLKLPKNDKGESATYTWRTIKQSFIVDENRADNSKSILLPKDGQPLYIASMIYYISGNELLEYKGDKETQATKKTKKDTLLKFIESQREALKTKKAEFESKINNSNPDKSIDEQISEINTKLDELTIQIDEASNSHKNIADEMFQIEDRLNKNYTLLSRYNDLSSQYATDINRLTFIVNNESLIKQRAKKTKCPYCDSAIIPKDQTSYIRASQAELVKAVRNSDELEETMVQIKNQIDDDKSLLSDCKERYASINKALNTDLLPERKKLTMLLQEYKEYMQIQGSLSYMKESDNELKTQYEKIGAEETLVFTPFKGKPLFYNLIGADIVPLCTSILTEIGYSPINKVELDKTSIDLILNGKKKSRRGKGYKAFTNSVLLLAFRKYLNEHSSNNFHFFMFDSPLKGLALPEGLEITNNIRAGFFNYLVNNANGDQIIIMENTKDKKTNEEHELPFIQETEDIKVYEFTQNGSGRYGFLKSVKLS